MYAIRRAVATAAMAALLALSQRAAAQVGTPVSQLVMYGIDADTFEFLRYEFKSDTVTVIGPLVDQFGFVLDHPECLTYLPQGEDKGFYCVPAGKAGTGGAKHRLARIDGMTGRVYMYPVGTGKGNIQGMVSIDTGSGWEIYAYSHGPGNKALITLDTTTGLGTQVMQVNNVYEGLAQSADGTIYGMTLGGLWIIEPDYDGVNGTETLVGAHGYPRTEALEFALGDGGPMVTIPGVPSTWSKNGALFSFADGSNQFLIVNPATGAARVFDCAFEMIDCEGLVLMTELTDPYGKITVNPHD